MNEIDKEGFSMIIKIVLTFWFPERALESSSFLDHVLRNTALFHNVQPYILFSGSFSTHSTQQIFIECYVPDGVLGIGVLPLTDLTATLYWRQRPNFRVVAGEPRFKAAARPFGNFVHIRKKSLPLKRHVSWAHTYAGRVPSFRWI